MNFDPRPYAEHCRTENGKELEAIRCRADAALGEARRLAECILEADSDVRAVILFGSLAGRSPLRRHFDIDLALDGGDVYKALEKTEDSPFDVDVVRLDRLPDHVRAGIETRGIVLGSCKPGPRR